METALMTKNRRQRILSLTQRTRLSLFYYPLATAIAELTAWNQLGRTFCTAYHGHRISGGKYKTFCFKKNRSLDFFKSG
ncbi:MAG: hypothetical protein RMJ33_02600 [Saprospiraceae bacterium]|nr:hypothetical protein [Saprospiraceae bacterium]